MSVAGVHKLRNLFLTALRAVRAASCERAANLIPDGARDIAGEGQTLFFIKGAFRRDRGEQRLGVRMLRIRVDSLRSVELHDTSQIHDHDPVADVFDDAEVMRDENISQVKLLLQAAEEVDDLCLDRNVQSGYRLVADDDLRLHGEGAGNVHTLSLAARELVGIALHVLDVETDLLKRL